MPYTVKGMDFTFTGLLTNATKALEDHKLSDVAYSLQETAFAMLCEAAERALLLTNKHELVVCGGVAQSDRLKQMLKIMARAHGKKLYFTGNEFNADNGAMIAVVAEKMLNADIKHGIGDCTIDQKYRINNVDILWE